MLYFRVANFIRDSQFSILFYYAEKILMQTYQHILMALDYSSSDQYVIAKALLLAELYRATLSIIHVLDDIPMPDTAYGTRIALDKASDNHLLEIEKQHLIKLTDSLGIDHARSWLVWGSPHQEITLLAAQEQIDLIILGSHPKQGLSSLLSSTADSVLHHTQCDILAVRVPV